MKQEAKDRLWLKIQQVGVAGTTLSDKDVDVLGKILGSEVGVKALALVYSLAHATPEQFLTDDLSDKHARMQAIRRQGFVYGIIQALETLLNLAVELEAEQTDLTEDES